jgi:antitoxin component HigA of HigAB toxin-antitoxin module
MAHMLTYRGVNVDITYLVEFTVVPVPNVIPFTPAGTRIPKTFGSTINPRATASFDNTNECPAAIFPRDFQLLMALMPTPVSPDTVFGPPSAAISSATVEIMGLHNPHYVDLSSIHNSSLQNPRFVNDNFFIPKELRKVPNMANLKEEIGRRIRLTRECSDPKLSQKDVYEVVGSNRSEWSNYENGEREISTLYVRRLRERFGWPVEWIIDGDMTRLPSDLRKRIAAKYAA